MAQDCNKNTWQYDIQTLLLQGILELAFFGDLFYKFKGVVGKLIIVIISISYKTGYNMDIMQQSAYLVINQIIYS